MTLALHGIGVAKGVAIGRAHVLHRDHFDDISHYNLPDHFISDELERYSRAVTSVKRQIKEARERIPRGTPREIIALLDVHLLMADDVAFASEPLELIRRHRCNAEWALRMQHEALVKVFDDMRDSYLRARVDDVAHVAGRILAALARSAVDPGDDADEPLRGKVVLADDLAPVDTVHLRHHGVVALVTEHGGPASHMAILARSLDLPSVVAVRHVRRYIRHDEILVVDGERGMVLAAPDERILKTCRQRQRDKKRHIASLNKLKHHPAVSRDGVEVSLQANIELPEDLRAVRKVAAEGVGLYRTEFLFLNREEAPGEDEQLDAYLRVVRAMRGAPVTIRTLDLGADKQIKGGGHSAVAGANPALGLRAIRLCLKSPELFRPQLRAILRASGYGPVRLSIPMLSGAQELKQVLDVIEAVKRELGKQGLKYDEAMPIGAMVEVPAAALQAETLARHLDFMSLGTNDLIQYTMAADRLDDEVNYLFEPLHPAVLRLIDMTIEAGRRAGIPVAMCGEMAGDIRYTPLLLGMGLREFSMHPAMLLEVKRIIQFVDVDKAARVARKALRAADPQEVAALIEALSPAS